MHNHFADHVEERSSRLQVRLTTAHHDRQGGVHGTDLPSRHRRIQKTEPAAVSFGSQFSGDVEANAREVDDQTARLGSVEDTARSSQHVPHVRHHDPHDLGLLYGVRESLRRPASGVDQLLGLAGTAVVPDDGVAGSGHRVHVGRERPRFARAPPPRHGPQ